MGWLSLVFRPVRGVFQEDKLFHTTTLHETLSKF